jgi:hypothetical protein
MRRTEDQHNSPEQVRDYAQAALHIADGLNLTPEDRAVLLPVIMGQLASKQVFYEQAAMLPGGGLPLGRG